MKISGVSAVTLAASPLPLKHFQSESHFMLDDIKNSNLSPEFVLPDFWLRGELYEPTGGLKFASRAQH